jgi:GNAT superfamily N-acetyltransferase
MPPPYQLRACRATDLPRVQQMAMALYVEDVVGERMTADKVAQTVAEFERHPQRGRALVAEADGDLIAYAFIVWFWSNEYGGAMAVVDELYVEPDWRGRGVGSAFFERIFADHPEAISLDIEVSPENRAAQDWYRRRGFRPTRNLMLRRMRGAAT